MADRIGSVAERFYRALQSAMPQVPSEVQQALGQESGGSSIAWTLSLALAGYRLKDETGVPSSLERIGVWKFVSSLGIMMKLMPTELETAMATAEKADSDDSLAGVAVYLKSAFDSLAGIQRSALVMWLKGEEFRTAAVSFGRKYPEPRARDGGEPAAPAAPKPNRAQQFDRAGFSARRPSPVQAATILISSDMPAPELSREDVTRASLHSMGWSIQEVDRVMSGPNAEHGAFFKLRQFLKTYGSLQKRERMIFQKIVDETEQGFGKSEWEAVDITDLSNIRDIASLELRSGIDLYKVYKGLSASDRMKAVRWIQSNERGFTAADFNDLSIEKIQRSDLE